MTIVGHAKNTIAAAQYTFADLSKLGLQWITIMADLLNRVYNSTASGRDPGAGQRGRVAACIIWRIADRIFQQAGPGLHIRSHGCRRKPSVDCPRYQPPEG